MGSTDRGGGDMSLAGTMPPGRPATIARRKLHWRTVLAAAATVITLGSFTASASAVEGAVTFPGGPLTVSIGPLGQCQSSYPNHGNNYYPGTGNVGDCGLFLAFPTAGNPAKGVGKRGLQGQTYGFNGSALGGVGVGSETLDIFEAAAPQSPVTGAGSAAEPYTQTTRYNVVDAESKAPYAE